MKTVSADGIDLPEFHPCIIESDDNGECKNKLRLKAAQVHTFMRISEELIKPLLGAHVNDIGWRAWLAHVKYFNSMMAYSFTHADLKRLDAEIQAHQELYAQVPGAHFLPKHHFARHVAKDMKRAGPYGPPAEHATARERTHMPLACACSDNLAFAFSSARRTGRDTIGAFHTRASTAA